MADFTNITNEQLDASLDAEIESCNIQGVETTDLLNALFEERSRRIKARHDEIMAGEVKSQSELIEASSAIKIQKKNGRILYYDGASYIMSGPTGTHTLSVLETSFERLAAHWSGFSGSKDNESFALNLKKAIVKAFLFRLDHTNQMLNNHFKGGLEMEGACFNFGTLAHPDVITHYGPGGNVEGYTVEVEWNRSVPGLAGFYSSDWFTCDGWEVMARTARAEAKAHLVEHILKTITIHKITLAQIVGAKA